eukprot:2376036-Amphidinium_carterae.1
MHGQWRATRCWKCPKQVGELVILLVIAVCDTGNVSSPNFLVSHFTLCCIVGKGWTAIPMH